MSITEKITELFKKTAETSVKTTKKPRKSAKKVVNKLNEAQTKLLSAYIRGEYRTLKQSTQRQLLDIIEDQRGERSKTTSCSKCWMTGIDPILFKIAEENGLK